MKCNELKVYEEMEDYVGYENDTPTEMYDKSEVDASIAELKAKLYEAEEARIEAGADAADYYQENCKLKRALWLARANDASSFAGLFSTLSCIEDDESRTYWIFGNKRKIVFDGLKCRRMETAYKWFCIWDDVANKCLRKTEEYK